MAKINTLPILLSLCSVIALQSCSPAQSPYLASCEKTPNLELVSLTMYRDPLPQARKIDQWRAIIRSDGAGVCPATLSVVDGASKELISHQAQTELSLGTNEVLLYSLDNYRLTGNEVCFEVNTSIGGNKVALKSVQPFCARTMDRGWWSMR